MAKAKLTTVSVIGALIRKHLKKGKVDGKAKAGEGGNLFESVVYALESIGFAVCKSCKRSIGEDNLFDTADGVANRIECNAPYNSVVNQTAARHGLKRRNGTPHTEFVIVAEDIKPTKEFPDVIPGNENRIRVECKYQQGPGTTEYKLLHSYLDLQYGATEPNVIMLVDGEGFSEKMLVFMREVCEEGTIVWTKGVKQSKKRVAFMNIDEFIEWANRAFAD
jgi:hypothetical protein